MRKAIFFITSLLCLACQKQESMEELTARVFERAAAQMELMDKMAQTVKTVLMVKEYTCY